MQAVVTSRIYIILTQTLGSSSKVQAIRFIKMNNNI